MPNRQQDLRPWHAERPEAVFAALDTSPRSLTVQDVNRRQQEFGRNLLPEKGPTPLWLIVLRQFISPLIYILVAAAVVSAVIGELKDAGFIAAVLVINAVIGAYQESQAEKTSHALRNMLRMITGDHRVTVLAIARDVGLAEHDDQVITAAELEGKSAKELADIVRRVRVFARVTPRQKLEIVNAARGSGHFVAVTGDGVNDAPALRAANIGVAMGKAGTDVAAMYVPFLQDMRKRTAVPSGISVHQRHPVMVEFSLWRFFFLHEPVVCGRRGRGVHPCGKFGCDQDDWRPRCRGGGNGSLLSRPARRMRDSVSTVQTDARVAAVAVGDQHSFEIVIDQKLIGAIAMSADGEVKDVERDGSSCFDIQQQIVAVHCAQREVFVVFWSVGVFEA